MDRKPTTMRTAVVLLLGCATLVALTSRSNAANADGSALAREALDVCLEAIRTDTAQQRAQLARGVALAQQAVAADEADPTAHFALFCNLGRQIQLRGTFLSAMVALQQVRDAIDRTLDLDPHYVDALLGKAGLLLELPRLLGGDPEAAERLARRALELDPQHQTARAYLARALAAQGKHDDADASLFAAFAH